MRRGTAVHPDKSAVTRALELLKDRDYTGKRLYDKLLATGYSEEEATEALERMVRERFVDDERYARSFADYHMGDRSILRIRQDLVSRGIDSDTVERILSEVAEEHGGAEDIELKKAVAVLAKKHVTADDLSDYETRQKIMGSLVRKGFTADTARRACDTFRSP